jgi:hypothetical protein
MAEDWLVKLRALDARITLQKARAQESYEADTWSNLRKELEHIVPKSKWDGADPRLAIEPPEQVQRKWTADDPALWRQLRVELEALRLKIRTEFEVHRSRRPPLSKTRTSPKQSSPKPRP